jgi:hypothetical protein
MGLLDDAIREHLELKRLRGADPSEVARAQREALEPTRTSTSTGDADLPSTGQETDEIDMGALLEEDAGGSSPQTGPGSLSTAGAAASVSSAGDRREHSLEGEWEVQKEPSTNAQPDALFDDYAVGRDGAGGTAGRMAT